MTPASSRWRHRVSLRLPPAEILRERPPPDDQLLVVGGGRNTLSDANLERACGDCWEKYGFFGVSVSVCLVTTSSH
jgi:hypothetical protein